MTALPTEDQKIQLALLDALADNDIDLSDIPEQGDRTDWVQYSSTAR